MSFQARAPVAEGAKWEPKVGEECEGVVFSSWPHNPSDTLRGRIYQFAEHKGVMCASIAGFFCHPDSLRPISPPPAQPTTAATEAPRDTQPEATGREGGGSPNRNALHCALCMRPATVGTLCQVCHVEGQREAAAARVEALKPDPYKLQSRDDPKNV